jgi:alkanesulfonate monooxygenase SsuD/methylene tetrahydromethanopterin reductase-like flavin-dependent oxidoreductase (luciferase family)
MPRPFKIGVQLPEVERAVRWPEQRAIGQMVEQVGFDSVWLGDHLLYRRPDGVVGPWEAWTSLAALAQATSRVEIGPLVACTAFHDPPMLAKMAATVDEISGGRLILGLGAGWNEPEFTAYGLPFNDRASRFEEAFTIIRGLLRDGHVDFEGRFYRARDCELVPRGPRRNGPPLMLGSIGPRLLKFSAPHIDSWNAWYAWFGNSADGLRPLLEKVDEACREVARDPLRVERTVTLLVHMPGGEGRLSGEGRQPDDRALRGTPGEIAAAIAAYAPLGIGHVQLVLDPITVASVAACAPILEALDGTAGRG